MFAKIQNWVIITSVSICMQNFALSVPVETFENPASRLLNQSSSRICYMVKKLQYAQKAELGGQ